MSDEIVVTRDMLKAIGADTRISILKSLDARKKTQSELASELKLSAPTVLEHLDHLAAAGLVEKIDEGRKWKYYSLTRTGKKLIGKSPINIVLILSISLFFALAAFMLIAQKAAFFAPDSTVFSSENTLKSTESNLLEKQMAAPNTDSMSITTSAAYTAPGIESLNNTENKSESGNSTVLSQVQSANILPEFIVFSIALFFAGLSIGYIIKKS